MSIYISIHTHVYIMYTKTVEAYRQLDEMRLEIESKNSDIARLDDLRDEVYLYTYIYVYIYIF